MPAEPRPSSRPIRLAILDDNPFVRLADGTVRPRAALFHLFAAAVVARGPFAAAAYLVPVSDRDPDDDRAGNLPPVDGQLLGVVPTAPFTGIAGYLARAPHLIRRNWPVIRRTVASADLVWIKAPASNAPLAALACRRAGVRRFTWVAGQTRDVVRGQPRGAVGRVVARAVAAAYDATTGLLASTGPAVRLDEELFTSVVPAAEVDRTRATEPAQAEATGRPARLVWAGRVVADKGLEDLLVALASHESASAAPTLTVLGDGAARPVLEARARALGLNGRVDWRGAVTDRTAYFDALRRADLFVLPSRAEGVPKVVVEAMAAGLPVIATDVGAVAAVLDHGRRGVLVQPSDPDGLSRAIRELAADADRRRALRAAGLAFAADRTMEAQADRLIGWLRVTFPTLPWPADGSPDTAPAETAS